VLGLVGQADEGQQLVDPRPMPAERIAGNEERQAHVLGHAEQRDEVEVLEHEAGLRAPGQGPLLLVEARDADPVDHDLAGGRQVESAQEVQHRRLAGSRRAHDGNEFAAIDGQGDAAQRLDAGLAERVALDEITGLEDHRHFRSLPIIARSTVARSGARARRPDVDQPNRKPMTAPTIDSRKPGSGSAGALTSSANDSVSEDAAGVVAVASAGFRTVSRAARAAARSSSV
jgi:hypothetical protein